MPRRLYSPLSRAMRAVEPSAPPPADSVAPPDPPRLSSAHRFLHPPPPQRRPCPRAPPRKPPPCQARYGTSTAPRRQHIRAQACRCRPSSPGSLSTNSSKSFFVDGGKLEAYLAKPRRSRSGADPALKSGFARAIFAARPRRLRRRLVLGHAVDARDHRRRWWQIVCSCRATHLKRGTS